MDKVEEAEEKMSDLLSEEGHKNVWDSQFFEAINAAMDAVEEQESMRNQPLPCLKSLESAMEEVQGMYTSMWTRSMWTRFDNKNVKRFENVKT